MHDKICTSVYRNAEALDVIPSHDRLVFQTAPGFCLRRFSHARTVSVITHSCSFLNTLSQPSNLGSQITS